MVDHLVERGNVLKSRESLVEFEFLATLDAASTLETKIETVVEGQSAVYIILLYAAKRSEARRTGFRLRAEKKKNICK